MRSRLAAAATTAGAGVAWAALVLGVAVATLTLPVCTSAAVQALGVPRTAGLSVADTVHLAGLVRALVADPTYQPLPAVWHGALAFDASAVSHLMDVRAVLSGAQVATGVAAAVLVAWVGLQVARRRWRALASGMRAGAWILLVVIVLGAVAALVDFEGFFAAFHGLFFKAGTWQFPYDSLLIRLFPERFWITAGAAWATLTAAGAAVLLVAARTLPSGPRPGAPVALHEEGSSRTAANV